MYIELLFYIVFLAQVLLLSAWFPRWLVGKLSNIRKNYPPGEYPKLYPQEPAHYERSSRNFLRISNLLLVAGIALLYWFMTSVRDTSWDRAIVSWYFVFQALPILFLDLKSLKNFRLMRLADSNTTRKASLRPRRVRDFVSGWLVGLTVAVYLLFCGFIIWMNQFDYEWFGGYLNIVIVTAVNLAFVAVAFRFVRGRKPDPHQDWADRQVQIENTIRIMALTSIALTLYTMLTITLSALELKYLQPVTISIYYQLLVLLSLRAFDGSHRNFEVYREDPVPG